MCFIRRKKINEAAKAADELAEEVFNDYKTYLKEHHWTKRFDKMVAERDELLKKQQAEEKKRDKSI